MITNSSRLGSTTSNKQKFQKQLIYGIEAPYTIKFDKWEPGREFTKRIVLKNLGQKTERISYKFPQTEFFIPDYPRMITLSSGMSCSISIRFKPAEMKNYTDQLMFTSTSGSFSVALIARLPQHKLKCTRFVDFGVCPVQTDNLQVVDLKNTGGQETFFEWRCKPPFAILPSTGKLEPGESIKVHIICKTELASVVRGSVVCLYGFQNAYNKYKTVQASIKTEFPLLQISNPELNFDSVYIRSFEDRTLQITNAGKVKAAFTIKKHRGPNGYFSVSKTKGYLNVGDSALILFRFSPVIADQELETVFRLSVHGGQQHDIKCSGKSIVSTLEIRPTYIDFGHVKPGEKVKKLVNFRNKSTNPLTMQISSAPSSKFSFDPQTLEITPESSVVIPFTFNSDNSGHFYQLVSIKVQDNKDKLLHLLGTCSKDFNEIPPGRHEQLLQEYKAGKFNNAKELPIELSEHIIQIPANSVKEIICKNVSKSSKSLVIRPMGETLATIEASKSIVESEEASMLKINSNSAPLTVFCLEATETVINLKRPEFVKISTCFISIVSSVAQNSRLKIPEQYQTVKVFPAPPELLSMTTIPLSNPDSDLPIVLRWSQDHNFTVAPSHAVLPPKGTYLFAIEAKSSVIGDFKAELKAQSGDFETAKICAEFSCQTCDVSLETHKLAFATLSVNAKHAKIIRVMNNSCSNTELKWSIPNDSTFSVSPQTSKISAFSSKEFQINFEPKSVQIFNSELQCFFLEGEFKTNDSLKLQCIGQAAESHLSADPPEIKLGYLLVNNAFIHSLNITNHSYADESICLVCEDDEGKTVDGVIDTPERDIFAKTTISVKLRFMLDSTGEHIFSIYSLNRSQGKKTLLATARGTGVYATLKINDVASIGRSKGGLWKSLSIDEFNDVLLNNHSSKVPTLRMDLGSCYVGEAGYILRIVFANDGLVPSEWHIYPANESFEEFETQKLLTISPSFGHLRVNDSSAVTFCFNSKEAGKRICVLMFELGQGFNIEPLQCRLELCISFLPHDGHKGIDFPDQILTLPTFIVNVDEIPIQLVKLPNPLPKDESEYSIENWSKNSHLELLSPSSGRVEAFGSISVMLRLVNHMFDDNKWTESFDIIYNDKYVVHFKLRCSKSSTVSLSSTLLGVPEFSTLSLPSQMIKFSRDAIILGIIPRKSIHNVIIRTENLLKMKPLKVSWAPNPHATCRPSSQTISPSSSAVFEFTFVFDGLPTVYDFNLKALVEELPGKGARGDTRSSLLFYSRAVLPSIPNKLNTRRDSRLSVAPNNGINYYLSVNAVTLSLRDYAKLGGDLNQFAFDRNFGNLPSKQDMLEMTSNIADLVTNAMDIVIKDVVDGINETDLPSDCPKYYAEIDCNSVVDDFTDQGMQIFKPNALLRQRVEAELTSIIAGIVAGMNFE